MNKLILFLACQFALPLFAQFTLQDSLVAHYPLDGNALDASGNGNHGVVLGAIPTTDRFGTPNSAYLMDGIDDFLAISASSPNFKPSLPVTIAAWVAIEDYQLNNVFQNDFTLGVYHGPWMNIVNGNLYGHIGDGGPAGPYSRQSKGGASVLNLSTWYHLATVIRGPGDVDLYINGKEDCGMYEGAGGPMAYSSSDGIIGVGTSANNLYLHGKIDEVRFYSRELDKEEIRFLADVYSGPDTICAGDSVQLDAGYGSTFTWTGANLSCNNCPFPVATPTTTTTYQAFTINSGGCPDTLDWTVVVKPPQFCNNRLIDKDKVWEVAPNPFPNGFYIKASEQLFNYTVEVYNHLGQLLLQREGKRNSEMYVSDPSWPSGIYMVNIQSAGKSEWHKMYKQ